VGRKGVKNSIAMLSRMHRGLEPILGEL
jgi:hypothetical protein